MAKKALQEKTLDELDTTTFVPSGDIGFDLATGGGWPTQCMAEIYGSNASGKTTAAFEAIYRFLQDFPKLNAYYYNYERSIDKFYVRNLLHNDESLFKRFKIIEPDFLEDGMDHLLTVMESGIASICVVDSLAAMQPKAEDDKALDKAQVGGFKAKAMAEVCRKIGQKFGAGSKTFVLFINHVNPKLNGFSFIPQDETPGGNAVKFWASLRIEVAVIGRLDKEEVIVGSSKKEKIPYGNIVKIKTIKNKFFPPYKRCVSYILYGIGINRARSLVDYAISIGLIVKKTNMDYCLKGKESNMIRGIDNLANIVAKNKAVYDYLYAGVSRYVEQKRAEAKNVNVDSLSTDGSYVLEGSSEPEPETSEVEQMFSRNQVLGDDSLDDGTTSPDDPGYEQDYPSADI